MAANDDMAGERCMSHTPIRWVGGSGYWKEQRTATPS